MKAYSMEFRRDVLTACDAGGATREVAVRFCVSESWVRRIKQDRRETGNQDHIGVFSQEENGKRSTRVLHVEASYDFRFALGNIKRGTVGFCTPGDHVDHKQRQ